MPKGTSSYREKRKQSRREKYLAVKSHLPYQHKSTLETSLEGIDSQPVEQCSSTSLDISNKESGICNKCFPVLSHYKETFTGIH